MINNTLNLKPLIEENKDKLDWKYLSANENAISILEQNLDKINWKEL